MESAVTLFLFLALALGSFAPAWYTGSLHKKVDVRLPFMVLLTGPLTHTLFFAAGIFSSLALSDYLPAYACIAGQLIILIIGFKLIIESIRFNPEEKIILIDDRKVMILVGLARGFTYLLIGLGLGFCGGFDPRFLIILFVLEIVAHAAGLLSGYRFGLKSVIRTLFLLSGIAILATALRTLILQF
ncbi:MAG: manganese efflux pump [Lentimicrobium sp.]|nr:manganese efflux pump [Lentimicrobium sp.]